MRKNTEKSGKNIGAYGESMTDWAQRPSIINEYLIQDRVYLGPKTKRSRWRSGEATGSVYILLRTMVLWETLSKE